MPPRDGIRTYVPEKHKQQKGPATERGDWVERNKLPLLIRLFVWVLMFRSAVNLVFALIVGLAPESATANFVALHFDAWPRQMPPEGVFYVSAFLYGLMAWRWYSRDWRARWVVMFLSGATAAKTLGNWVADRAADGTTGSATIMAPGQQVTMFVSVAINLLICGYLAFYPGMAQAFKETPWE